MHAWILALLVLASSPESEPWNFDEVASAIESVARDRPLYGGDDGVVRTVAEMVAVAARESHLVVHAVGHDAFGMSLGLFQVHETNLPEFGYWDLRKLREDLRAAWWSPPDADPVVVSSSLREWVEHRRALADEEARLVMEPSENARMAIRLLAESHRVCCHLPLEDQLSEYASGMGRCDTPEGLRDSRNRMRLAAQLLDARPPFWTSRAVDVLPRKP